MHLYSEKDVWCRWRSVTLWQVELLFLLFHQWCYITGLRVSSPFWCEKHAHAVAVLNFIHACIHTWMDLHLFWPKAYFHIIRKAGRSVVSQRGLHLFFFFFKEIHVICTVLLWTQCSIIQHGRCFLFLFFVSTSFIPAETTYFSYSRCLWWHGHMDKQQFATHWII